MRGAFVTFEGPEGAGKSTALAAVAARLRSAGYELIVTREPGAGTVGAAIRQLLLDGDDLEPRAELFLFLADRAQHVAAVVGPALAAGRVVLCDRHADSTVVYQGYGRGLDLERLRAWNAFATGGLQPDLTLLLDLDPRVGLERTRTAPLWPAGADVEGLAPSIGLPRPDKGDRIEREAIQFHKRVRAGFLAEAEREPHRWRLIDASQDAGTVAARCWEALQERLELR